MFLILVVVVYYFDGYLLFLCFLSCKVVLIGYLYSIWCFVVCG